MLHLLSLPLLTPLPHAPEPTRLPSFRARLAIFCGCAVLLPDLLRAEPPCTAPRDSEAYQALHVHMHEHCMSTARALHEHCMGTTV